MRRARRWFLLRQNTWIRWRLRHGRKSQLQRDWESGDPVRMARVTAVADRIIAEMREDESR